MAAQQRLAGAGEERVQAANDRLVDGRVSTMTPFALDLPLGLAPGRRATRKGTSRPASAAGANSIRKRCRSADGVIFLVIEAPPRSTTRSCGFDERSATTTRPASALSQARVFSTVSPNVSPGRADRQASHLAGLDRTEDAAAEGQHLALVRARVAVVDLDADAEPGNVPGAVSKRDQGRRNE